MAWDDTGAYQGARNYVDNLPSSTLFDLADPTSWRFFWDYNMKIWHDTMRFMRVGFNWSITQVRDIQGWDSRCRVIESVGLEELGEHLHRLTLNQCMMLWALQFTPTYGVHLLQFAGNK